MAILAAAVIFVTVFVLFLALSGSAETRMRSRLEAVTRPQRGFAPTDKGPSMSQRLLGPIFSAPSQALGNVMPESMAEGTRKKLILAGEPMTPQAFMTLRVICFGAFSLLPVMVIVAAGASFSLITMLVIGGFVLAGIVLPQMWLSQRVGQRKALIIRTLPDAFDLITTCVEAGLGLDAALARVAEKVEGPFADELSRMLRDVALGKSRRDALRELGERTGVPDLVQFVNAVIQAELMGSSLGAVLRVQAVSLRVRRRQRAEEQAYKAPVKMIFPLVLCIFPSLFIVILGPAIITIMTGFPT